MNFDLRRPCASCPFRHDVPGFLSAERAREIVRAMIREQATFACHKTVDYDSEDGEVVPSDRQQHCAGALIMLDHMGKLAHIQLARIAMRLGMFNPDKLDMNAPVFSDAQKFIRHHTHSWKET